jgi:hypothetical protein
MVGVQVHWSEQKGGTGGGSQPALCANRETRLHVLVAGPTAWLCGVTAVSKFEFQGFIFLGFLPSPVECGWSDALSALGMPTSIPVVPVVLASSLITSTV